MTCAGLGSRQREISPVYETAQDIVAGLCTFESLPSRIEVQPPRIKVQLPRDRPGYSITKILCAGSLLAEREHQLHQSFDHRPRGPRQLMPSDVEHSVPATDIPDPPGTELLVMTPRIAPFEINVGDDWLEDALVRLG